MKKWFLSSKKADFNELAKKFNIDPVIARIIRNREVIGDEAIGQYINGTIEDRFSPEEMKGINEAVSIIVSRIKDCCPIRIIGDYDIDGVCATYILTEGLKRCNADVDYAIPDRVTDGYGINDRLIKEAFEAGKKTIITCDNGIAAKTQIEYANTLNMCVIVTDHHEVPYEEIDGDRIEILPPAKVIVNPKQKSCTYPDKNLCGAVVALKLVEKLWQEFGIEENAFIHFLEFAAIATVGDVVDLVGENRLIVKYGLKKLLNTTNIGLKALIDACEMEGKKITSYHIGFVLGPCINAGGRLKTALMGVSLFMEKDYKKALSIANNLKELNEERKFLTVKGVEQADEIINKKHMENDKVLVLYLEDCHESILGIIAGRLKEKYYRPVLVLSDGDTCVKGSGRSIESYNMYEELIKCRHLFDKFGGHSMACGCSLEKDNIDKVREFLNENTMLTSDDLAERIVIDVPMPLGYITEELINQLEILEPFGKGNEKPVFALKDIKLVRARVMGKNRNVLKLEFREANGFFEGVYFGDIEQFESFIEQRFGEKEEYKLFNGYSEDIKLSIIYYPDINEYNGRRKIQVVIKDYC